MKIIYLSNIRAPSERMASHIQKMHMCEAFASVGHDVLFITLTNPQENPFEYYNVGENFEIQNIFSIEVRWAKLLKKIWTPKTKMVIRLVDLLIAKVRLMFQKYDVLFTRQPLAGLFFKNYVLELHTLPENPHAINKRIWKRAKYIITITNNLKKQLLSYGVPEEKILVAPDGVDLKKFADDAITKESARKRLSLPEEEIIVGYTGHVGANDKLGRLETLKTIAERFSQGVSVYGVGCKKKHIDVLNKATTHIPNLHIVGKQPHKKIVYWQKAFDILVLQNPSHDLTLREHTSPMKLFEYMASERPIVASDLPSTREILDENNAFLVEPDSPQKLADMIEYVINNPEEGSKRARQARKDVEQYTWKKRAQRISAFIQTER